jgi:hypothetical protein
MPVTASRLVHRAPARAWTRGSPNLRAGALRPFRGHGGVRDPLKGWTRKDAALADAFSIKQSAVGGTGLGLHGVEVVQATLAAQVIGVVDHGLDPQRPAVFEVLLDPGMLVEGVHGHIDAAGDHLGLERLGATDRRNAVPIFSKTAGDRIGFPRC